MKISEEDKKLVLQAQKIFPEVHKYLEGRARDGVPWPDLIHSLKELLKVGEELRVPWAFLKWVLQECEREREQKGVDNREREHQAKKIKDREWLKDCKLGDLVKGVGE